MAIVRKHRARVRTCRAILPDVYTASFESLDKAFKYRPGQFLHLAIDPYDPSRQWPDSRCFSIQTPPTDDGTRELALSFSVKGKFTSRMAQELVPGSEVWLKMPYGDLFSTDCATDPCVFIAGGTGVTPFLSLFLHSSFRRFEKAALYLGVRSAPYHVFGEELRRAQSQNSTFEVSVVEQDSAGLIPVDDLVDRHGAGAVYFLSGPPAMIRAFREDLVARGVPGDRVKADEWE